MLLRMLAVFALLSFSSSSLAPAQSKPSRAEATAALHKAVEFFTSEVSAEGGYLWRYSEDLSRREGEGRADDNTVWVQPPGTPSVGEVLLDAYNATADKFYLEQARRTGMCLVNGQLRSGGWDYRIEFDPQQRRRYAYRVDPPRKRARNTTTLDDDTTQAALRFLMRLDKTLMQKDAVIHEAVEYGLASLLKAQYPAGAWPQRYAEFPDPAAFPVKKASYPSSWPRKWPKKNYQTYYTFNDNSIADVIDMMFLAARTYNQPQYEQAARRGGDFILLAQLPEPQPAWAQQYNPQMQPAWARKFEPPAVTGGESQGVMRVLLQLYRETGDKKYLAPIPKALAYLRQSQISDGKLARFYELKTNRPLYFTKQYELTYNDDDLPTHYGFQLSSRLDSIERQHKRLSELSQEQLKQQQRQQKRSAQTQFRDLRPRLTKSLSQRTGDVISALDERGRWIEDGRLRSADNSSERVIDCRTFIENVTVLCRFVRASGK